MSQRLLCWLAGAVAVVAVILVRTGAWREEQKYLDGGDVFKHHALPAIDPANYPPN